MLNISSGVYGTLRTIVSSLILHDACPANYQQGAVSAVGPGGGGANYAPVNPYDDRSSNANIIHRSYSTQPYG